MENTFNVWRKFTEELPPEQITVETKIEDKDGTRNECRLTRRKNLMYQSSGQDLFGMYVYYTPTHWRYIQ